MPAKFNLLAAATVPALAIIPLIACGGDSKKSPDASIHTTDSPGSGGSGSATCTALAMYSAVSFGSGSDQFAGTQGSGSNQFIEFDGFIQSTLADPKPDDVTLELYASSGPFGSGIHTGTFTIAGDDAQYKTCGVCVRMFTDEYVTGSGSAAMLNFDQQYFASGGTVTLTDIGSDGSFKGTLHNITMQHVTIAQDFTSTPVGDCTSNIPDASMNTALTKGSAALNFTNINVTGNIHFSHAPSNVITRRHY